MNDTTDPLATAYDADDAAMQDHRREAAKVTRVALLFAIPFVLMLVVVIVAVIFSMKRDSEGVLATVKTPPAAIATTGAPVTGPAAVNDKDAEIARLRSQIAALQQVQPGTTTPTAPYADAGALALITARLDRIEANQRNLARAAAAANTAAALQQAAQGDAPFLSQLAAVEANVDDPALVAMLRPHAQKGVPSEVSLAVEFPSYAARAHIAANSAADDGLMARIGQILNLSIRRTDDESQGPDALLHSAETRLNVGDLRGAVAYLTRLPPAAQTALKPWLDKAQARISVDDATHRLTETALARLSQGFETAQPETGGVL